LVEEFVLSFAREAGEEAVSLGYGVVSGGAEGCDRAGTAGAGLAGGVTVTVLPCGLGWSRPSEGLDLSVCAPDEPFSTANAMERNALIYAASEAAVVAHSRFRAGGTWHGAADAVRRRLTTLLVREDPAPGHRALVALGGVPLASPGDLSRAMEARGAQGSLFGIG
jgi:predicted Rossmann fold nucleotide-binding protein DprA/Smf involved in DNA uptake